MNAARTGTLAFGCLACLLPWFAPGCANEGLNLAAAPSETYLSMKLPGTREQIYQAMLAEMKQRFGTVNSDGYAATITAAPQYLDAGTAPRTGRLRIISTTSDLRRKASARVGSEGGLVQAQVRVVLEQRDTAQHAAYHAMMSHDDVPTETPIDRGAGLEPERREVWTLLRRDEAMERELLASIERRLNTPANPQ